MRLSSSQDSEKTTGSKYKFKTPSTPNELSELIVKSFAPRTEKKVDWALKAFKEWRKQRVLGPSCPSKILWCDIDSRGLNKAHLCYSLCAFLNEVMRQDGNEFPGKSLYQFVVLIQFHLEKLGLMWKLMDDSEFVCVCFMVDNLMKKRASEGLGNTVQSSPISLADEEYLWRHNILGEQTPKQLRDTVLFLLGIGCTLRGG